MKSKRAIPTQVQPVVRRTRRKCSGCHNTIKIRDGSVYMRYGIYCIPCAENRGAFDRFQSDDAV